MIGCKLPQDLKSLPLLGNRETIVSEDVLEIQAWTRQEIEEDLQAQ